MRKYVVVIVFSLLACPFSVNSQQPLVGSIQGTIQDQQGAPVPYVSLTATNVDSVEPESHRRTIEADKHGAYQFIDVPTGRYEILMSKNGFQDYKVPLVTVHPGETVKMPAIKMTPAAPH